MSIVYKLLFVALVALHAMLSASLKRFHRGFTSTGGRQCRFNRVIGNGRFHSDATDVGVIQSPQTPQNILPVPVKTMIFMDGTWVYYSLVKGRVERNCPIQRKFGKGWQRTHRIDWPRLPQLIARSLEEQINGRGTGRDDNNKSHSQNLQSSSRVVDITRTSVFTSLRDDTAQRSARHKMVSDYYKCNFDVHKYVTARRQEKCVDISMAVEMMYLATVPNAYDIAVVVTGDKDFLPAMEKTRLLGKRVAIVSMRNGCNADLVKKEARIRDFDIIWLDDNLEELIVRNADQDGGERRKIERDLLDIVIRICQRRCAESYFSSRDLGRELQNERYMNMDALSALKLHQKSLKLFLQRYGHIFKIAHDNVSSRTAGYEFMVSLCDNFKDSSGTHDLAAEAMYADEAAATATTFRRSTRTTRASDSDGSSWKRSSSSSSLTSSEQNDTSFEEVDAQLIDIMTKLLLESDNVELNSREIGRSLKAIRFGEDEDGPYDARTVLRRTYRNLYEFAVKFSKIFEIEPEPDDNLGGFLIRLVQEPIDEIEEDGEDFEDLDTEDLDAEEDEDDEDLEFGSFGASGSSSGSESGSVTRTTSTAVSSRSTSEYEYGIHSDDDSAISSHHLSREEVHRMSVVDLKDHLRALGQPVSGVKAALVDRLLDTIDSNADTFGNI